MTRILWPGVLVVGLAIAKGAALGADGVLSWKPGDQHHERILHPPVNPWDNEGMVVNPNAGFIDLEGLAETKRGGALENDAIAHLVLSKRRHYGSRSDESDSSEDNHRHGHGSHESDSSEENHSHRSRDSGSSEENHSHGSRDSGSSEENHSHGSRESGSSEENHSHGSRESGSSEENHGHDSRNSGSSEENHSHGSRKSGSSEENHSRHSHESDSSEENFSHGHGGLHESESHDSSESDSSEEGSRRRRPNKRVRSHESDDRYSMNDHSRPCPEKRADGYSSSEHRQYRSGRRVYSHPCVRLPKD